MLCIFVMYIMLLYVHSMYIMLSIYGMFLLQLCVCVMGEPSYDNSFRILNNFPMTCITKHKFAKANVFSVKGII